MRTDENLLKYEEKPNPAKESNNRFISEILGGIYSNWEVDYLVSSNGKRMLIWGVGCMSCESKEG